MVVGVYYFIKVQKKNKTHGIQSKVNCPELDGQKFLYKQQHFFLQFQLQNVTELKNVSINHQLNLDD